MEVPARLHMLLARNSPQAVVIRRGPSGHTAVIGWDRSDNSFVVGQWLKGKIYHYRSDLSPDGRHWIYFAMNTRNYTWTAVAKAPYLKALDFYPKRDAWNGGGLFISNKSYWLNESEYFMHRRERHTSSLSLSPQWDGQPNRQGECPGVYFRRLARDGWTEVDTTHESRHEHLVRFCKRVNDHWQLWKLFRAGQNPPVGKGPYSESHLLHNVKSGEEIPLPDAEWADLDKNRFLWAEKGKILSGWVSRDGLQDQKVLLDANPMHFAGLIAPY